MIQFSQLWGLAALVSLPLIILLFALRPKRKTLMVSTNRLWHEAIRERQRGQGLHKLLRDLSLLLFLLFALMLSLGLAGLIWTVPSTERDDVVVILDVSASMQARGDGGLSRFEDARNQVAKVINGLDRNSRLLLMTSGRAATIRTAFESDRAALGQALEQIQVTDEAGDPRQAMALSLSLLRKGSRGKIYFVTDRAFTTPEDLDTSRIEFKSVQGPFRNLAITGFEFRAEVGSEERHQVLVSVRNYTAESLTPELRVELGNTTLLAQPLALDAGQEKTLVLPLRGRLTGVARAVLGIDDDLATDNEAFAVIEAADTVQILLVSPGNMYLDSVLAALPNVRVEQVAEPPADFAQRPGAYDIIIMDSIVSPPALPAGNFFLVNTLPPNLPLVQAGQVVNPLLAGTGNVALMQDIALDGLRINRSQKITHDAESAALQRLFWSNETALALALVSDSKRIVWLGFDLADSNFPLHAAYPLFLSESLAWLHDSAMPNTRTHILAGESIRLAAPVGVSTVEVRTPGGQSLAYTVQDGAIQFRDTAESGIYQYSIGNRNYQFAVNLTDDSESDIQPRALPPVANQPLPEVNGSGHTDIPLWPWLVMVALLLLVLEWCLWCRRGISA